MAAEDASEIDEALDQFEAFKRVVMGIYVIVWTILLVLALTISTVSLYLGLDGFKSTTFEAVGLTADVEPEGRVVRSVHGTEARVRGIRPGDVIIAIDGVSIAAGGAAVSRIYGPDGSTKRLTLRSPGAAPRTVALTRSRANVEAMFRRAGVSWTLFWAVGEGLAYLTSLLLVAAAILLFRQRRTGVAALLSLGFLYIAGFLLNGGEAITALNLNWLMPFALVPGWSSLMIGIMTMPDGRFSPRWTRWLALATLLFWLQEAFVLTPAWVASVATGALLLAAIVALAIRYRGLPPGSARQQLRWTFLGFAAGAICLVLGIGAAMVGRALSPTDPRWTIWSAMALYPLLSLTFAAFALGLVVSLLRYRLYDADAVIGRSAGFAVLTLLVAGTFGASAKLVEWVIENSFGQQSGALPGAIGAGLAVVLITPLHGRIQAWAERRFQRQLDVLRRDLPDAVGDLRETATLAELIAEVRRRVERGVHAVGSEIVLVGEREQAAAEGAGTASAYPLAIPLHAGGEAPPIATLLVGPRPDGTPPGRDEGEALRDVAGPIARAIEVVRRRAAREAALDERLARMEARIDALTRTALPPDSPGQARPAS
jgi:hypothetical protein